MTTYYLCTRDHYVAQHRGETLSPGDKCPASPGGNRCQAKLRFAPTDWCLCSSCHRGIVVDGPCSCCGLVPGVVNLRCGEPQPTGDQAHCAGCHASFATDARFFDHQPCSPLDPRIGPSDALQGVQEQSHAPVSVAGTAGASGPELHLADRTAERAKRTRRLHMGGTCRKGLHVLTHVNVYRSPSGVWTCKDCRSAARVKRTGRLPA